MMKKSGLKRRHRGHHIVTLPAFRAIKTTGAGRTGSREPNWRTAPNVGDVLVDHEVIWENIGTTRNCMTCSGEVLSQSLAAHYAGGENSVDLYPFPDGTPSIRVMRGGNNALKLENVWIQGVRVPDTEVIVTEDSAVSAFTVSTSASTQATAIVSKRPTTVDDEAAAGESLAYYWNKKHGTSYASQVELDKSKYADGYLRSKKPGEPDLPLQVRHFHDALTRQLKQGKLSRFALNGLPQLLQAAIDSKSRVDTLTKAETILLLYSPVPLDHETRRRMTARRFEGRGFRAVFLAVFRAEAIPLQTVG